jgi:hypothetical protein
MARPGVIAELRSKPNQNPAQKPGQQQQGGGQKPGQQQQDPNRQGQSPNKDHPNKDR